MRRHDRQTRHRARAARCLCLVAGLGLSLLLTAPAGAQEPARITMWDIPESAPYGAWWRAHIKAFNAAHPESEITLEIFETEAYRVKIASALASGTAADIFYLPAGRQGQNAVRTGQALPLDGLLDADAFTAPSIAACSVDGRIACMPLYIAPTVVFYNLSLFAAAGIDTSGWTDPEQPTWAEFLAACARLKAAGILPIALGNADNWPGALYLEALQARYGGIAALDATIAGRDGARYATSPSFIEAARKIAELGQSGFLPLGYNGIGGGETAALFTSGRAAMAFQGPWWIGRIAAEADADFRYSYFRFPSLGDAPPEHAKDLLGGFDALYVSAKTAHRDTVARFLNSFAEPAAALSFMTTTGNISVVKSALSTAGETDMVARLARTAAGASAITPWWDTYLPPPLVEESMRHIQGLFDGSLSPAQYLMRLDRTAGR